MSQPADRNLLYGILALQMDFVSRDALLAAMHAWVLRKNTPLGQVLREQGALAAEHHDLLEALVQAHLRRHDDDPQRSLAALRPSGEVPSELRQIADADVQASLTAVRLEDPAATGPAAGPPPAGQRYQVLHPHARGGLGEVFVALDTELRREVAFKQIQEALADDPASRRRFVLEAEITGQLEHPGVVPVYGLGHDSRGRPYYAMRFIRGDSLQEAIPRFHQVGGRDAGDRRLALRELLGRFVAVCNAVAYAHSRGIIHRDLKPANVLLGPYGETLVVDWGLARSPVQTDPQATTAAEPLRPSLADATPTRMGEVLGSPAYMSPEQAAGRLDELGPASDVYSLGATLYCLLTGQPPVAEGPIGEVLQRVQRGEYPRPRQVKREVPEALEAVCVKALALRPGERYASARALAEDVERWLADEPVSAYREPLMARLRRWGRRHQQLVTAAAALLLTATAALVVGLALLGAKQRETDTARQEALGHYRTAEQQRARAQANFQKAREAVERMLTRVGDRTLRGVPGLEPLRRQLLEDALEFNKGFLNQQGDDPAVRESAAWAQYNVAEICAALGRRAQAEAACAEAIRLFEGLVAQEPAERFYRNALAESLSLQGELRLGAGQAAEAETAQRRALDLIRRLVADFPEQYPYRRSWLKVLSQLDSSLAAQGKTRQAEEVRREALKVAEQLARNDPERAAMFAGLVAYMRSRMERAGNMEVNVEASGCMIEALRAARDGAGRDQIDDTLAGIYADRAVALHKLGRRAEAEQSLRESLTRAEALAKDAPLVPRYRHTLAYCQEQQGELLMQQGRFPDATTAYRKALARRELLAREAPDNLDWEAERGLTHIKLGHALMGVKMGSPLSGIRYAFGPRTGIPETLDCFDAAVETLTAVRRRQAGHQQARSWLAHAYQMRGGVWLAWEDSLAARADYEQALSLADNEAMRVAIRTQLWLVRLVSNAADDRILHANRLARRGKHEQAAALARTEAAGKLTPMQVYNVACVYGLCAGVTRQADRKADYNACALEMLRRARDAGYFRQVGPVEQLKKDANLAALHGHADFKKLLAQLQAAAGGRKK
jgi:serine/threonine-protein kinase